jgi:hypothetical protein
MGLSLLLAMQKPKITEKTLLIFPFYHNFILLKFFTIRP